MKFLYQSSLLILMFVAVFIWSNTALSDYTFPAIALLIVIYLLISFFRKRKGVKENLAIKSSLDICLITSIIFLIILQTNGLYSVVFFLLYFLAFGITFVFEPLTVFIFLMGTILVFLPGVLKNNATESYIRLGSLLLICPLAYYFGQGFKERSAQQENLEEMSERAKDAANTIAKDVDEVIKKEKKQLDSEDVQKLNEILEETEDLREEKE